MSEKYDDPYSDKPSNAERAAEIRLVKDPSMYRKTTDSKKKKLAKFGDYMAKNESRGHKILATKLGNLERMKTVQIPTPAERQAQLDAAKKKPVAEAEDLSALVKPSEDQTKYPKGDAKKPKQDKDTKNGAYCDACDCVKSQCKCKNEAAELNKHNIQHYSDKSRTSVKKHALQKAVAEETLSELSKRLLGDYANKANQDALDKRQEAGHTAGAERAELKSKAQKREAGVKMADNKLTKEDFDRWDAELKEIDEATSPMQKLRDAHDRHMEKALAANRAGDDEKVKVHQVYMQKLTAKMSKLKQNESVDLDEARNPQRGVKVGHKVRSYDFPGMHDDHYIEGHVVGESPSSYHIKVNKVVRGGKEIPTPAHMAHVEAPKGKSIWTDAYAVHKLREQHEVPVVTDEKGVKVANPELPAKGAAKTFSGLKAKLKK